MGSCFAPIGRASQAGKTHGLIGGAEQGLGLVDAFLMLVFGNAVGDDAGAGLDIHLAVLDDGGAQHDAGVHVAIGGEIADAAGIDAALARSPARQ